MTTDQLVRQRQATEAWRRGYDHGLESDVYRPPAPTTEFECRKAYREGFIAGQRKRKESE